MSGVTVVVEEEVVVQPQPIDIDVMIKQIEVILVMKKQQHCRVFIAQTYRLLVTPIKDIHITLRIITV